MRRLELAILGLINMSPKHGYEIEKVIQKSNMRFWADIAFSSIYSTLKGLKVAGLVTQETEQKSENPPRKIYYITEKGVADLESAIKEVLSRPKLSSFDFNLGLNFMTMLEIDVAIGCLKKYSSGLSAEIKRLDELWTLDLERTFSVMALLDHSRTRIRTELDWVNRFIVRLEKHEDFPELCCHNLYESQQL